MSDMAGQRRRRRPELRVAVAGIVLAAALAAAFLAYTAFAGSGAAPPPAALADTPAPAAGTSPPAGTSGEGAAASPDGTWTVQAGEDSFVGYRVSEQLAFLDAPNEAVGRTTAVTGSLEVAGGQVVSGRVEADLGELASDEARRDNAVRQQGLESDQFPTATFELAEPVALNQQPSQDQPVTTEATGALTIHGVTRDVTVTLQGRWSGDRIEVAGQIPVRLTDYGIIPPEIGPVVSIEDEATVDLQLTFVRG